MSPLPEGYELTEFADPVAAHAYLSRSYWSPGIPLATVERAIANSLCVAVFHGGQQAAMARLLTDFATHAYLADLYVLVDKARGNITAAFGDVWANVTRHAESNPIA